VQSSTQMRNEREIASVIRAQQARERQRQAWHEKNYSVNHDYAARGLHQELSHAGVNLVHHIDHANSGTIDHGIRYYTVGALGLWFSSKRMKNIYKGMDAQEIFVRRIARFTFQKSAIGFPERFGDGENPWKVYGLVPVEVVHRMCDYCSSTGERSITGNGITVHDNSAVIPYEAQNKSGFSLAYGEFRLRDADSLLLFASFIRSCKLDQVPFMIV